MSKLRRVLVVMLSMLCLLGNVSWVYADSGRSDVDAIIDVGKNLAAVDKICSVANKSVDLGGKKILVYTGKDGLLSFSNANYSKLVIEDKQEFMRVALLTTAESGLTAQTKNKVYNFISNQDNSISSAIKYLQSDASADFASARGWFKVISSPVSKILGFLCVMIFLFLSISIVVDVAYLELPFVQMMLEMGKGKNEKPAFISREAWRSSIDYEKDTEHYTSVINLYLKRRAPVILFVSLILGYLISGAIYNIFVFFVDAY